MKKFLIIITANIYDEHYVSQNSVINEEQADLMRPLIGAIKGLRPYMYKGRINRNNFPYGMSSRTTEKTPKQLYGNYRGFPLFLSLVPMNREGFREITSVELYCITNEEKLM